MNVLMRAFGKMDRQMGVIIFLIIVISVVMAFNNPYFLTVGNFEVMASCFLFEAIMALGMTFVIVSGGIDLSVGGVFPLSAILMAMLLRSGVNYYLAMLIVLVVGATIGFINNELRRVLNIHPMIVTMAMLLTLRGLNLAITDGRVISGLPSGFIEMANTTVMGLSLPMVTYLVLAVVCLVLSKGQRFFLHVYFVGGNPTAAELSGVRVERIYRMVYMLSGLLAGVAGVLATMVYNSASANFGQGIELRVITAVAIGGASLTRGGIGSIEGTILGSLFLAMIYNTFVMSGVSAYYQDVFTGLMLVIAVVLRSQVFGKKSEQ